MYPVIMLCLRFTYGTALIHVLHSMFPMQRYQDIVHWPGRLIEARADLYAAAVFAKGCPHPAVIGFIDGKLWETCRPREGQRVAYSGHHKAHGMKSQAMVHPDGLVVMSRMFEGMCTLVHLTCPHTHKSRLFYASYADFFVQDVATMRPSCSGRFSRGVCLSALFVCLLVLLYRSHLLSRLVLY
jgi:hypothetical protein